MTVQTGFFQGTAPVDPRPAGPSVWRYQPSDRRIRGKWEAFPEPSVPVVLHSPTNWATVPAALLDTGADTTAIPYGWAGPLGVDLDKAESLTAFGNGVLAEYLRPVEKLRAEIAGVVIDLQPIFGPWEAMFLGRDVFDHFRVIFDQRAGTVVLDPYEDEPR
jgi:hypothetical protein